MKTVITTSPIPPGLPIGKAIGITSGVGSLLIGAREAGFEIVGNIEWRTYYGARDPKTGLNTFETNFPGAFYRKRVEDLAFDEQIRLYDADVAMSHPECGNWSLMTVNKDLRKDASDIPLAINMVDKFKPRFFALDEMPGALQAITIQDWKRMLPDYDIFPEWISNYHYGNVQWNRRRMFMIGALKDESYVFTPGEFEHNTTVWDVIGNIPKGTPNNEPSFAGNLPSALGSNIIEYGKRLSYHDLYAHMRSLPTGRMIQYYNKEGDLKWRLGVCRLREDGTSHLLYGGHRHFHPRTGAFLTTRERARIQGVPDNFVFVGAKIEKDGTYIPDSNIAMAKQTGKFMPVQFGRFINKQFASVIKGEPVVASGKRVVHSNPMVDRAKLAICHELGGFRGKDDQQYRACFNCWLNKSCYKSLV